MPVSNLDRRYVSRYTRPTFAVEIYRGGAPGPADGPVTGSLFRVSTDGVPETDPVWTRDLTPASPGTYEITLSSVDTKTPGAYDLVYDYEIDGAEEIFATEIEIGPLAPDYDALNPAWASTVDGVWLLFADLFDSPYGGPNLQVYVQTKFGRNRLAQLLRQALQTLNTATSGHQSFPYNEEGFPFAEWGGLLQRSLYIEVLRHLVRSYTEQPEVILGTAVSRVDRRDYMQRWNEVLSMEMAEFNRDLSRFKMAYMGLGNVHVLVSGGAFGNIGPYVNAGGAGEAAARGYFVVRRGH